MRHNPAHIIRAAQSDAEFRSLARGAKICFALTSSEGDTLVSLSLDGATATASGDPEFTVVLPSKNWDQLLAPDPDPGTQHVLAHLPPRGPGNVHGNETAFAQHLHLVRRLIDIIAERPSTPGRRVDRSRITGRYVQVTVEQWGVCDVYVEETGAGQPVLFLHTAGSDSSQFHGLFALNEQFPDHQFISFDLPWHGRSAPADGAAIHDYSLTSESYANCVAAVISALELTERPTIVGASMAGAAVIEVVARHPDAIKGAISCQAGPRVANRQSPALRSPIINQALFVPEWTFGLMSPSSPKGDRDRVWWGYSQGAYAVYAQDIEYYSTRWDIDTVLPMIGPQSPPTVLMSGAYDYTVPPSATKALADEIPGAVYRVMPELGHFPHAENPSVFAEHLRWALETINGMCLER